MKNFTLSLCLILIATGNLLAQQEKGIIGASNWLNNWTEFRPNTIEYGQPTQILSGNISKNTKLYKKDTYLLLGSVFVTDSTTLTIEPGTVIIGDFKTDRKSTRLNSSHVKISYAVFCLKKKKKQKKNIQRQRC